MSEFRSWCESTLAMPTAIASVCSGAEASSTAPAGSEAARPTATSASLLWGWNSEARPLGSSGSDPRKLGHSILGQMFGDRFFFWYTYFWLCRCCSCLWMRAGSTGYHSIGIMPRNLRCVSVSFDIFFPPRVRHSRACGAK